MKSLNSGEGRTGSQQVDDYLAAVAEPRRGTLNKLRKLIRSVAPPETAETISYGIPTFKYKGSLVGYAAFSKHCSLFPVSAATLVLFAEELKGYATSKGTIRFPLDKPLPAALVKKIVKARIAQNHAKSRRLA